jgi:antitoxin component of MazEF toxin-antitoxin module
LTRASSRGNSLRTTVPVIITHQFSLAEGDRLSWEIRAHNNDLVISVIPVRAKKHA